MRDLLREELRPAVREALTDEVLRGVRDLVSELPAAIQAALEDLESRDETIRQRAYTLIFKHTMGSAAVLPVKEDEQPGNIQVFFNMPRPGIAEGDGKLPATVEGVEIRTCDSCHKDKPASEFEQGSDRCTECHVAMRASAMQLVGKEAVQQDAED